MYRILEVKVKVHRILCMMSHDAKKSIPTSAVITELPDGFIHKSSAVLSSIMSRPRGSGLSLLFLYLLTFLSCASFATASGECYPCIPNPVQDPCYGNLDLDCINTDKILVF